MGETGGRGGIPQAAAALGYAGALPFIILAIIYWISGPERAGYAVPTLIILGAVVLAFLGGVRWGLATASERGPGFRQLVIAILPALVAAGALHAGEARLQLALLMLAFFLLLLSDLAATRSGEAPAWYPGLRMPLTLFVELSLGAALLKLLLA